MQKMTMKGREIEAYSNGNDGISYDVKLQILEKYEEDCKLYFCSMGFHSIRFS